ncbi:MAG: hypothetical protein RI932_1086, partial [Pseudomonadota bacterium]
VPLVGELPKAYSLGMLDKVGKKLGDYVRA